MEQSGDSDRLQNRQLDDLTVVAPRQSVVEHSAVGLGATASCSCALVRKELKVKYKNSTLGFAWSLLNPLLYLVVYYYVFQVMLGSGIRNFPIFLLSGLLIWTLFSSALNAVLSRSSPTVPSVQEGQLPREILPLSVVGAALVHFLLQFWC